MFICSNGVCTCTLPLWTGDNCEILDINFNDGTAAPDPCATVNCQNNGTCDAGTCTCEAPWTGSLCETLDIEFTDGVTDAPDPCEGKDCNGKGTCTDGVCTCSPPWIGDNCETLDIQFNNGNFG